MTAADVACRIAAIGLVEPGLIDVVKEDEEQLLSILREQRIEGVAVHGISTGAIRADESFAEGLVRRHDETMAQTLRIELMARRVAILLSEGGIEHRLLKGAALAHTAARNPADRAFRDVDMLVRGESIDTAVSMLERAGARRLQPQLRSGFDARFGKSVTMTLDEVEVDLHRVLAPGPFGVWMRPQDLFLLRSSISIGGVDVTTLDATNHLVHACYHVALGSPEPALVNLRDIAQLAFGTWDQERFGQTIERWRGRAAVRRAVRLVEDQLEIELPTWLGRYRHEPVDATELAAIEPYLSDDPRGRFAALAPATIRALPLGERPAFARAVGLPDGVDAVARAKSLIARVRR